jgi:hypothetical protein
LQWLIGASQLSSRFKLAADKVIDGRAPSVIQAELLLPF